MPGQQAIGSYFFKLTVDGHEAGLFKECTGLSSEFTHTSADEKGKSLAQRYPGELQWSNLNLKRGVDSSGALWKWRQEVLDGRVQSARKDGTVEVVDWEGKPVCTYSFVRGWPCKYSAPGLMASGNEVLVEEIEIAHEGFERVEADEEGEV
jgi:phage tail-like protein